MWTLSRLLIAGLVVVSTAQMAAAASCYDLWYERNAIFNDKGYCFNTELGRETFDNGDCWTDNPRLSRAEQRRVDQLLREERRRGCKVN